MKVFIYRHAEAEDTSPDETRKLTPKGRKQVKKLAEFLPEKEFVELSEIWHSPLTRAKQTAVALQKAMPILADVSVHEIHELEPDAEIMAMAKLLAECEGDVVICGHNPFLEQLVTALSAGEAGDGLVTLKKGGMLCMERTHEMSTYLPSGLWTIQWYMVPRLLG